MLNDPQFTFNHVLSRWQTVATFLSRCDLWKLIFSGKLEFTEIHIRLRFYSDIAEGRNLLENSEGIILLKNFHQGHIFQKLQYLKGYIMKIQF